MNASVETLYKGNFDGLVRRVPIADITTRARFEAEREKIFRRSWLHIGNARDLPEKGSYVVTEVPPFNASVLLIRGQDGVLRGFHNVCTHRGNKLVQHGAGCAKYLTCGFHGWSFTSEGALNSITDEKQFRDLDKTLLNLKPINVEAWNGHIFANFDAKPRQTLKEWLGPLFDQYDGYFERHAVMNTRHIRIKCNWNLAINAFLEGYHTLYLHGKSVPDYQGGPTNPERHRPYMEMFERHIRYSAPSNPHHHVTPAEEIAWRYGRKGVCAFDGDMTGMPPGINPSRANNWAFDVIELFPHSFWLLGNHNHVEMNFWPVDEDNTVVTGATYGYRSRDLAERLSQEFQLSRGRIVLREDLSTLEAQHDALKSGALSHIQLSEQERAVQHHYRVATDMLSAP
jgi:phenylpropionate dioxygenase-like ring-hydroxylating dioxygenase large terminal subunit